MNKIQPFDFYMLRLPSLPLNHLDGLHTKNITYDLFTIKKFDEIYQSEYIQEAIYLASPDLHAELMKWLSLPLNSTNKVNVKLLKTLHKYLLRMCSRSTPYGLFAGFSVGDINNKSTTINLSGTAQARIRHSRLDMNYVAELASHICSIPEIRKQLKFHINDSLYKVGAAYRYYEYRLKNKRRSYYLVSIKSNIYLEQVFASAKDGCLYSNLVDDLINSGVSHDAALGFIEQLTQNQILVTELEPTVTGKEFFNHFLEKLNTLVLPENLLVHLKEIANLLAIQSNDIEKYHALVNVIAQNFPPATSKDLVQTDLHLNMGSNVINKNVIDTLSNDILALAALNISSTPADLMQFKTRFQERYEDGQIPLLEVLDSESGIGYGLVSGGKTNHTPLIDDLVLPGKAAVKSVKWSSYRKLVLDVFLRSKNEGSKVIQLQESDLLDLNTSKNEDMIPPTFFAIGSMLADSAKSMDAGDFKFAITALGGPTAITLMARFAHACPDLTEKLKICADKEQACYGDKILAEIVHLPESRVGNIIQRPQIRAYEIPFLGNSSVPNEYQIPVSDLLISIVNHKVVLMSKRLGKEIIPRLTTAHNYNGGITVYKFLCDLQHQSDSFTIRWDWGVLTEEAFLPRIEFKHVIISKATWRIKKESHQELNALSGALEISGFLKKHNLPKVVVLADGDNELLLDFNCACSFALLAERLKKQDVVLKEFLQTKENKLIENNNQEGYVNEMVIPFYNSSFKPVKEATNIGLETGGKLKRSFAFGSEWTYVKLYCGPKWADKILTETLLPVIEKLQEDGLIKKWFFIRYNDPDNHLRIRFFNDENLYAGGGIAYELNKVLEPLMEKRIIHKIQYDTYHREIERYKERTMEFSESIFHHDSVAVAGFLNMIEGDEGERYRWLFALRGVDRLLSDFNLSIEGKLKMTERISQYFFKEFNGTTELNIQLNNKYREVQKMLGQFVEGSNDEEEISDALALFMTRSKANSDCYRELKEKPGWSDHDHEQMINELIPSFLHMFLNRIFISNQRIHELVIYHYLKKMYKTRSVTVSKTN